ncbi:hypothetical protein F444_22908 [Phytophthora nicotianae P1976]|uniref:Uncharacterized protein n=1 Tax=Phytophthora nicotianae P1976 TaxID=1317066 RepID=A0A080YWF1_PHYNI|nr:hypothetical protein F444_22908 [Phytophthora nicotianae P1976]
MSSHGWSGEGLGEEASEGLSGWAPPLEARTPPPAEIREDEDEDHAEGSAEGDARRGTPTEGGSNEGSERGTPRRTEPRVEGREARRDGEGTLGSEPLSPRARRMAESVLDTPRGREMFNQFLARLARQPAPSEEPAPARTTTGETAEAVTSTLRARQRDAFSFDASRPSLPLVGEMQGENTVSGGWHAQEARRNASEGGGDAGKESRNADVGLCVARDVGRHVQSGTAEAVCLDWTPTRTPRPTGVRPVSRPVSASTGNAFVGQTQPASAPMLEYQGSTTPRVALPAQAPAPGMPMAAIPSYGGVTIQAPSTSWNKRGDGTARLGALYPPFQPPIAPTAGWSSSGMLPAWSAAPATQTPASVEGLGLGRSFSGQGGGYPMHSAYPQGPMVS